MTDKLRQDELDYWRAQLAADPSVKVPIDVTLALAEAEDDAAGS